MNCLHCGSETDSADDNYCGNDCALDHAHELRGEVALLRAELQDAVRCVDRFERAVADPTRIGDYDPIPSALASARLARGRWRGVIG